MFNEYEKLLRLVYETGVGKDDRTGTGTRSIFGHQMRFDLSQGFPLVTTKKIHIRSIIVELLWFLTGQTNIKFMKDQGVTIWDEWADENGFLGPVYGSQWRSWPAHDSVSNKSYTIDQIYNLISDLKTNPDSRRHIVSAWNVADIPYMALPPCHVLFQFYVAPAIGTQRRKLSCQLYQRSADVFLGVPFNIASYALLTHMVAQQCDFDVGEFIWTGGDCHIYNNHKDQVELQLSREVLEPPKLNIKRQPPSILDYWWGDFEFLIYNHHPAISAPVAV